MTNLCKFLACLESHTLNLYFMFKGYLIFVKPFVNNNDKIKVLWAVEVTCNQSSTLPIHFLAYPSMPKENLLFTTVASLDFEVFDSWNTVG